MDLVARHVTAASRRRTSSPSPFGLPTPELFLLLVLLLLPRTVRSLKVRRTVGAFENDDDGKKKDSGRRYDCVSVTLPVATRPWAGAGYFAA